MRLDFLRNVSLDRFRQMSNRVIASVGFNARDCLRQFPCRMRPMCFPEMFPLNATVDCSDCLCDCLLASTVAMANPAMPTVPGVQYEALTGEQLAVDVAALSGLAVEEVRSDGVQASLIALHLTGGVPETRQDLIRLATGESFVRPTAFERVTAAPGANVLTMDVEIGDDSSDDSSLILPWASGRLPRLPQPPCRMLSRLLPLEFRRLFHCLGLRTQRLAGMIFRWSPCV